MEQILNYLRNNIDANAHIQEWDARDSLNAQLIGTYDYYYAQLLDTEFLLIRPIEDVNIGQMQIHMNRIKEATDFEVAILLKMSTPYKIKKMLECRIPFLDTNKQMYIPFMALHIRKQNAANHDYEAHNKFTPSTQLVYLHLLYQDENVFAATEIGSRLRLSTMTVLRAMNELECIGALKHEVKGQTGKKKIYYIEDRNNYYNLGKQHLQNPVRETIYIHKLPHKPPMLKSGEYALSEKTMLGTPRIKTYALDWKKRALLDEYRISKEEAVEDNGIEVQLITYDIGLLTEGEYVDPITLINTLRDADERTELAIDELMEEFKWYQG